jgi:hypothetical protein
MVNKIRIGSILQDLDNINTDDYWGVGVVYKEDGALFHAYFGSCYSDCKIKRVNERDLKMKYLRLLKY